MAAVSETFSMTSTEEEIFTTPAKIHHRSCSVAKVRVIVRLRPFLSQEISSKNGNPIPCATLQGSDSSSDEVTLHLKDPDTSRNESYKLDAFFGQDDYNVSQIFETEIRPLIPGLFQGENSTVFAYGATGSGKTYTMQGSDVLPGIMHLAISTILSMCKYTGSKVAISYYEIYLEKCYDLLNPEEKEIMVLNDKDGQMHLKGLAQVGVNSMDEFREIFASAIQRRKVAHTGLNDVSSRSHGVLVIAISTLSQDNLHNPFTGKLNLIDLAGNEDNMRTYNEGIRLQESSKINQSLFALSNVIFALNNNQSRIPYRESKLTRVLQDSLGGKSRALMVACLNPGEYQESVHTVSLAARSRHVSNFIYSSHKNTNSNTKVDMDAKLVAWLESKGKTKSSKIFGGLCSQFHGRTPCSVKSLRKLNTCPRSNDTKAVRDQQCVLNSKKRSPCKAGRNLFERDVISDLSREAQSLASVADLDPALPDESQSTEEEATVDESVNACGMSKEKIKALKDPQSQREVFSPINLGTGRTQFLPSDPKTPNLHPIQGVVEFGTPLDKFTARSSRLKSSLIQDYIEFLNRASREELMELKGIGEKTAEYIIELRETCPLKCLGDLEKIGLSTKQVQNLFGRAARGLLLENLIYNA
ncbi:hypothetical protein ACS0TY_026553 [Phlomoides rotata]